MTFVGMTPDQIDSASTQLRAQASELQSVKTRVDSLVSETSKSWNGRDSQSFSTLWYSTYQTKMIAVIDRLNTLASALAQQAADQRATSSDTIGTTATGWATTTEATGVDQTVGATNLTDSRWFFSGPKKRFEADRGGRPDDGVLNMPTPLTGPVDTSDEAMQPGGVDQRDAGDCWFMAALGAVANTEAGRDLLRENLQWDEEAHGYWVTLYDHGDPVRYFVDETYADGANGGDSWEAVYEAAMKQHRGKVNTGSGSLGMEILTGNDATLWGQNVDLMRAELESGAAVTIGSNVEIDWGPIQSKELGVDALVQDNLGNWSAKHVKIVRSHEYIVERVDQEGNVYIRNPWGPENRTDEGNLIMLSSEQYYENFWNQSMGSVE